MPQWYLSAITAELTTGNTTLDTSCDTATLAHCQSAALPQEGDDISLRSYSISRTGRTAAGWLGRQADRDGDAVCIRISEVHDTMT